MVGPTSYLANEADRLWVSVYDGFSRMSVPLFMIVSAFLLAPMSEKITSWEFYKKRFMRILPPFFVFFVLYSTLPMAWGQIGWDTASKDLSRLLLNFPTLAGHFWFMYPLISIYLIIPVVSPWLRKATAAEERFFLLLFAISTCIPFLNRFCGEVWGQCFWNEYHMLWYFSGYLGYLVMAHYIRTHLTWSCTRKLTVGAIALVAGAVGTILSFYLQATPGTLHSTPHIELGWAFCTPTVLCLTSGCFLMMSCINGKAPAFITQLSKLSFGIYLMHIFWLGMWVSILKPVLPTATAIPAITVCTFISCAITSKIISLIPGSKYIIG
jgi:peptidoglycan/LPS O-acetylase OafA/YrhL